jgi:hypothetical protein
LIARKTKYDEIISIFFHQGVQLNKIPDSCASHSCYIVYKDNFPSKLRIGYFYTFRGIFTRTASESFSREIVKRRRLD